MSFFKEGKITEKPVCNIQMDGEEKVLVIS